MKTSSYLSRLVLLALALSTTLDLGAAPAIQTKIVEGYPDWLIRRIRPQELVLQEVAPKGFGNWTTQSVIHNTARWKPAHKITVAFRHGCKERHLQIARAASEWTNHANIFFDFGYNPATGECRRWTLQDTAYAADIRISFNQSGYWAIVGSQSTNSAIVQAHEPSMNFKDFDRDLPADWIAVVLHEFGHALGFAHEHQHPVNGCDSEFRWDDDPGYVRTTDDWGQYIIDSQGRRPGIYTVLDGPPNGWSKDTIDHNLRQLRDSRAFLVGPFDPLSIMKYHFESWMFVNGGQSRCYTAENTVLSAQDKKGALEAYPRTASAMANQQQLKAAMVEEALKNPNLPSQTKGRFLDLQKAFK